MRYTLFNAGKRIRPALVLQVCKDLGGDLKNALPIVPHGFKTSAPGAASSSHALTVMASIT